ncbi:pilus assembly protein [Guyparkeria sp. SCN-R1]|uniref:pilus assembly PilX family protein n=1 Tax=Guyparkeria sp. SCN-R1 TaxID=2341113 RepID=UPI000F64CA18|nr:PilX N-terminal domain-containing pilus assembly protein [Guyparkeria sp. SCN-R1]RRQ23541.1 pilus assembly protein [Guyparkeria sp. SCN-R1]
MDWFSRKSAQSGIALVIALILLLVISLVGLASIRGTTLQEKMSSNLHDRDLAFQAAEAALRAAERALGSNSAIIARECFDDSAANECSANPAEWADDPQGPNWQDVDNASDFSSSFQPNGAPPQYTIDDMGLWPDPTSSTGINQSGAGTQYGAQGTTTTVHFYRVTARSADPTDVDDRAVVWLQGWVRL